MKKVIVGLFAFIAMAGSASAAGKITPVSKVLTFDKAVFNVCLKDLVGCANTISVMDKKILFVAKTPALGRTIENGLGSYQFHKMSKTQPFTVTGRFVKATGLFPNPTVAFDAFQIYKIEGFVVPR